MQQTAVEWLENVYNTQGRILSSQFEQAKQMEKEQKEKILLFIKEMEELIKEMEDRVSTFEKNRDLYKEIDSSHFKWNFVIGYWDGKRSEAAFMVEKLTWILENE